MLPTTRIALGAAVCLLAGAGAALGQSPAREPTPLEFRGFRPGDRLSDIAARVEQLEGVGCAASRPRSTAESPSAVPPSPIPISAARWRSGCRPSTALPAWSLCPAMSRRISSTSGARLEARYGRVGAKVQGPQWMMQWVRQDRMIRLTWRIDRTNKVASVALVDGSVLDAWGRERARRSGSRS